MSKPSVELHEIKLPPNFKSMPDEAKQGFIAALAGALMESNSEPLTHAQMIEVLEAAHASYHSQHEFKMGDLVMLKPAMASFYNWPKPGLPCKVLEVLKEPFFTTNENSPSLGIGQNLRIGFCGKDASDYAILTVCPHFFEPYKAPEQAQAEQPKEASQTEAAEGPY